MMVVKVGSIGVTARREAVWAALHDADHIALCVPGCRGVVARGDNSYAVAAAVRFGPVRVAFDGTVEVSDYEEPVRLCLTGRGGGGLAGEASGTATIRLTERAGGCRISYELCATTDGPIARLGSTFLSGLAGLLADRFSRRFAALFTEPAPRPNERAATRGVSVVPS